MRFLNPFLLVLFLGIGSIAVSDEKKGDPEKKPAVTKIGETRFRIGQIEFDARTREVFVPVAVNQREGGPLEYVLVHETGKVHESILVTRASPLDLQIALKLLRYRQGEGDIFDKLLPSEDRKRKGDQSEVRGTAVTLLVRWRDGEKAGERPINDWVLDGATIVREGDEGSPMKRHPWNYTGSIVQEGSFLAEVEGSIIAIYLDPVSLFNTAIPGSEVDERWGANHHLIPEIGTKATLVIRPE